MTATAGRESVRDPHVIVPFEEAVKNETARLSFDNGLENLALGAGAAAGPLLEANFSTPVPEVWAADNAVHVAYPLGSRMLHRLGPNSIGLHPDTAWSIDVHGGAAHLKADLTGTDVRSFACYAGAARVRLALGRPAGQSVIRLTSVKDLHIDRPADVPVRLEITGSCTKVRLDDAHFGAVSGGLATGTDGSASADAGYLVMVSGSAETLTVAC